MFKVKDKSYLKTMGFVKNEDGDFILRDKVEDSVKIIFTIYAGSLYLRYAKTAYTNTKQLKYIYDWTKMDYIDWEE